MAKTKVTGGYIADSAITSDHLHTTLDLSTKTLTIGATTVSGHIIPDTNITYDLGSSSNRFRDIYLDTGTIHMGTDTKITIASNGELEIKDSSNDLKRIRVKELEFEDGAGRIKRFAIDPTSQKIKTFDRNGSTVTADKIDFGAANTDDLSEGSSNLYFTTARARGAISVTGSGSYNSSTGVITVTGGVTSVNSATGEVTLDSDDISEGSSNLYFTNARARGAISVSGNALSYNSSTGVLTANYEESPSFTGNVTVSGTISSGAITSTGNMTIAFDSNNSGNRLRIADTEGASAAVRTYSTADGTGLILNHYYAVAGSPYVRYSDFVSSMGDGAATNMRFLTKPHNGNPTVALTIDQSQNATFAGAITTGDDIILPNDKDVIFRNASGSDDGTKITRAGGNALRIKYTGNSAIFDALADNDWRIQNSAGDIIFAVAPNSTAASSSVDVRSGKFRMGTTTVIDSSRNLLNIGTISSGAITSTGAIQGTSFSDGTISGITFIDEDSFSTNSATRVPTQQSIKAYVDAQVAGVVDTAPSALNTLNELAAALGDDANFSTTTSTALGNRLRVDTASQGLTGAQQANAITNLGITATKAELNFVDGVTSNIQTQLNTKLTSSSGLNASNISSGTLNTARLPNVIQLSGGVAILKLQETDVTNSPNWWHVADGGNYSIRLNNTGTYPISISTNATNDAVSTIVMGYNTDFSNGIDVTGNITVTGTVDGRDIATDGTKLDTIATNADVTPSWVPSSNPNYLTGNQTITLSGDVSGSGTTSIAVTIADDSHNHVISNVDGLQTALDGKLSTSGTAANSQLLDSLDSTAFLRSNTNDSFTGGELTISSTANRGLVLNRNIASPSNYYNDLQMEIRATSGTAGIGLHRSGYSHCGIYHNTSNRLDIDFNSGDVIINHNAGTLWGSGNDGSGSGLDADTVDGIQGASLLRSDAADTASGALTFTGNINQTSGTFISHGSQVSSLTTAWQAAGTSKSRGLLPFRFQNGATGQPESGDNAHWGLNIYAHSGSSGNYPYGTQLSAGSTQNLWHRWWANGTAQAWRKIWDTANDGSGSGLDADLLDGQQGSYYLPSNTTRAAITNSTWAGTSGYPGYTFSGGNSRFGFSSTAGVVDVYADGNYYATDSSHLVWHAGNDGSGSGLDADLLDGQQGSYYLNYNNFTNTPSIPSSSSFITTSSTAQTKSGILTLSGGLIVDGSIDSGGTDMGFYQSAGTNIVLKGDSNGRSGIFFQSEKNGTNINHPSDYGFIQFHPYGYGNTSGEVINMVIGTANDSNDQLILQTPYTTGLKFGYKNATSGTGLTTGAIWHFANDGAGSGLDADLLDGQHGSHYLNYNNLTNKPTIPTNNNQLTNGAGYTTYTANQAVNTTSAPTFAGLSTNDNITFNNSGTTKRGIRGTMGDNDMWFIGGGATASNAGYMEIATGDDGQSTAGGVENMYFSSYGPGSPWSGTLFRRHAMFDSAGQSVWNFHRTPTSVIGILGDSSIVINTRSGSHNYIQFRNDADDGTHAGLVFTDNNHGGSVLFTNHSTTENNAGRADTLHLSGYQGVDIRSGTGAAQVPANKTRLARFATAAITLDKNTSVTGTLACTGNLTVSSANATGGGIILADDGDIVDLNDAYCSMRFSYGVRVFSANRGGSAVIALKNDGQIIANSNITAYGSASDIQLKENIEVIDNPINKVQKLRGVTFDYKKDGSRSTGLIAQELEEVLPEVVYETSDPHDDDNKYKAVRYGNIVGLLVEAIKEQQQTIEKLTSRINDLEKGE